MSKIAVVGLVGGPGSGKTTVAEFLETHAFTTFRFSDIIRDELLKQNILNPTREQFQDVGDGLRTRYGRTYLATKLWEKVSSSGKKQVVLDGFRNPGDMEPFSRSDLHFVSFALLASPEARFKRVQNESGKDSGNWKEFLRIDRRDQGEGQDENGQNTLGCIELADYKIDAEKAKEEVFKEVVKILENEGII